MGKIQEMSEAEREIMKIIWDNGGSVCIAELIERVEEKGKDWKRTTIRTFLTRLMEKGLIIAERQGRMSRYTASVSEEEYLAGRAKNFVNEYFNGSVSHLLASLLGEERPDDEAIDELQKFWESCKEDT